jgi:hypothetical protein
MSPVSKPSQATDPARQDAERPRFRYPDPLTQEDLDAMDRVLDVDGEAFIRWLAGEGPEPTGWRDP